MLGGYMAGVTVSGVLWAVFQNNAGGAWDNAKKSFEAGVEINGEMTFKGSDAHKAAVTGDTVGDPFKDTSGPSMNILIKLTCLIGLVIAPILGSGNHDAKKAIESETKCEMVDGKCVPSSCGKKENCHATMGKCDMNECANMTKEACAKMCDENGCTPAEKKACLAHFDENGKWIGGKMTKDCCKE
jgi:K(+)-stimulated pyrophosphate-energized sodium pump